MMPDPRMEKPDRPARRTLLTVSKAARVAGVAPSTIRFYEREGLLLAPIKSRSGYRLYDDAALARLRFLRAAKGIGLPLKDIRAVLDMDARTSRTEMRRLLESRLREVERKVTELTAVRDALTGALARCRRSGDYCSVLVSLSVGASAADGEPDHEDVHVQDRRRDRPLRRGAHGRMPEHRDARGDDGPHGR